MSVNPAQYERIMRNRRVYFGSAEGKAALRDALQSYGWFEPPARLREMLLDPAQNLRGLIEGFLLLRDLGVFVPENYDRLIDALATLPAPQTHQGVTDGETT